MPLGDELERIEAATLRSASFRGAAAILDELVRIAASSGTGFASALLDAELPRLAPTLAKAVRAAWAAGITDAATLAGVDRPEGGIATGRLRELDAAMTTALGQARALLDGGASPEVAAAPLQGARSQLNRYMRAAIVDTGNLGALEVAELNALPMVWVAETNACVRCLAYAGTVVEGGEAWEGGMTYGRRTPSIASQGPVHGPQLHPNCRCFVEPLGSREYADALRREADRSVLRGFSLQSEPMSVRIDAARRLLERRPPVDAPASVIAYARRAVEAGTFATRGRPSATDA